MSAASPPTTTSPARWVPIESSNRIGQIFVASSATLSIASILCLGTYSSLLLRRHYRKSPMQRANGETRAVKFLTSSHFVLFCNLLLGDLLQAIGFSMTFEWVRRRAIPTAHFPTNICTAQAVFIQVGDLASAFSSVVICVNLFLILVFQRHTSIRVLLYVILGEWVVIALLSLIGPAALVKEDVPFYGPSGAASWCWMSTRYVSERLTLHYLWVFLCAGLDLLLYAIMAFKVVQQRKAVASSGHSAATVNDGAAGVAKVMMLYPMVYIATILPLSIYRIAGMAGKKLPVHYALAAGTLFTISGTANCIVYALTRSIVSFDSIGRVWRRGSDSLPSSGIRRLSQFGGFGGGGGNGVDVGAGSSFANDTNHGSSNFPRRPQSMASYRNGSGLSGRVDCGGPAAGGGGGGKRLSSTSFAFSEINLRGLADVDDDGEFADEREGQGRRRSSGTGVSWSSPSAVGGSPGWTARGEGGAMSPGTRRPSAVVLEKVEDVADEEEEEEEEEVGLGMTKSSMTMTTTTTSSIEEPEKEEEEKRKCRREEVDRSV